MSPKDFQISGSNNLTQFTLIDKQHEIKFDEDERREFKLSAPTAEYRCFKLEVSKLYDETESKIQIAEIELLGETVDFTPPIEESEGTKAAREVLSLVTVDLQVEAIYDKMQGGYFSHSENRYIPPIKVKASQGNSGRRFEICSMLLACLSQACATIATILPTINNIVTQSSTQNKQLGSWLLVATTGFGILQTLFNTFALKNEKHAKTAKLEYLLGHPEELYEINNEVYVMGRAEEQQASKAVGAKKARKQRNGK